MFRITKYLDTLTHKSNPGLRSTLALCGPEALSLA